MATCTFFCILCLCSILVLAYRKILHMFSTGEGLLLQRDSLTNEGLQQVFATNLFGHYVLVSITLSAVVSSIMDIDFLNQVKFSVLKICDFETKVSSIKSFCVLARLRYPWKLMYNEPWWNHSIWIWKNCFKFYTYIVHT